MYICTPRILTYYIILYLLFLLPTERSEFSILSAALNLNEFKFEDQLICPSNEQKEKVGLDVTALDRYNDEVRRYRKIVIEECRNLSSKYEYKLKQNL